ncbi:MAG TPA: hypothetical protein VMT70_18715 [Vicinamibacteria bacterium]|nr:hypothetical protein [Vicinamibacteria bacterium]
MGVRTRTGAPTPQVRPAGPGFAATLVVVLVALILLLANGRPVGTPDLSGPASWLLRGAPTLAGKALAALFAALAAGALFAAVARRHGLGEARWAAFLLALGTTLAAAAQAWSGEAAATCAVAVAVLLLLRSEEEADASPAARAGLPLGLAVALQPSTVALAALLVVAVIVRWRRESLLVLVWAAPGPLLALASGLASPSAAWSIARGPLASSPGPAALALLASPAKGALVFAPVALVGIAGLARALRAPKSRLWDQPQPSRLFPAAFALAVVAHFAALAVVGGWASGEFWGPRGVAPSWPLLLAFVPEGFGSLGVVARLLAVVSVAVQALGALTYDGRWDRLHRGPSGDRRDVMWSVADSPIAYQAREAMARVGLPAVAGRAGGAHGSAATASGATGSFVSFAQSPPRPTGVEGTMSAVRVEAGARVEGGHLVLETVGDGLAFHVPEGAWPRRLELRVVGRGRGTLGVGESAAGGEARWRDRAVSGSFRLRLPYHEPEAGGPDVRVSLRSVGPIVLESVALVPPTEPEDVIRLP